MTNPETVDVATLERDFPWIKWREPIRVSGTKANARPHFGCRVCIAMRGLRGNEVETLPATRSEWERHFTECHITGRKRGR